MPDSTRQDARTFTPLYLPIALMIALAVISRPLAGLYLARLLGVSVSALPAEWTAEARRS